MRGSARERHPSACGATARRSRRVRRAREQARAGDRNRAGRYRCPRAIAALATRPTGNRRRRPSTGAWARDRETLVRGCLGGAAAYAQCRAAGGGESTSTFAGERANGGEIRPSFPAAFISSVRSSTIKSHPHDAGWSSPVAREAHNLEVVGSNPTPATSRKPGHPWPGLACFRARPPGGRSCSSPGHPWPRQSFSCAASCRGFCRFVRPRRTDVLPVS